MTNKILQPTGCNNKKVIRIRLGLSQKFPRNGSQNLEIEGSPGNLGFYFEKDTHGIINWLRPGDDETGNRLHTNVICFPFLYYSIPLNIFNQYKIDVFYAIIFSQIFENKSSINSFRHMLIKSLKSCGLIFNYFID